MSPHENLIAAQILADCVLNAESTCYNRKVSKDVDNCWHDGQLVAKSTVNATEAATSAAAHLFPANEEPNVLGHGPDYDEKLAKYKWLCNFDDAPNHLKFNPYIRRGYRTFLSNKLCLQSIFWWTNETINIWSHLVGCILFICLTIFDFQFLRAHASLLDQVLVVCLLTCFCLCMLMSSLYHVFSCRSEQHYELFLSVDFLGITLSLVAIYTSGMYYAFWCFQSLRVLYSVIALGIFVLAIVVQIPKLNVSMNAKVAVLLLWSAYGIIPLAHWSVVMGGLENKLVTIMVPRIIVMYLLCLIAFVVYSAKIPERWFTGKVDFVGHSHNWWHLIIVAALYHWHNTGLIYAEYRSNNSCSAPVYA